MPPVGEIMREKSHPLWIIQKQPNLPIHVACGAPSARVVLRCPRAYAMESRLAVSLHVLAVCEGMSGGPSILIVDLDESFHRTVDAALRGMDCACDPTTNAEDARRKLETGAHEVALVNLDVPGGLDLLQPHRGDGVPVPVIAVTGRPSIATAVQAFRAGAVDYLVTPLQRDDLRAAVERAMERSRALRAVQEVEQLLGACTRWFRDVQTLLAIPGAWSLPPAIREALTERRETGPLDHVLVRCLGAAEVNALTRREREVLLALAQGQRGRDLARCLQISVNTCRTHVKAVLKKLGVRSQRALLARLEGAPRGRQ
jgi:FixJ family two-component response regulator